MQAVPPSIQQCVPAAKAHSGSAYFIAAGDPTQVNRLIADAATYPKWKLDADAVSNGVRFIRLTADIDLPYEQVGGLIYKAQLRRLAGGFTTTPTICEAEDK